MESISFLPGLFQFLYVFIPDTYDNSEKPANFHWNNSKISKRLKIHQIHQVYQIPGKTLLANVFSDPESNSSIPRVYSIVYSLFYSTDGVKSKAENGHWANPLHQNSEPGKMIINSLGQCETYQ